MASFSFSKGLEFSRGNRKYKLRLKVNNGWQVENALTGMVETIGTEDLYNEYIQGNIRIEGNGRDDRLLKTDIGPITASLDMLPEKIRETIKNRRYFLEAHLRMYGPCLSRRIVADSIGRFWREESFGKAPHVATAIKWIKAYVDSGKNVLVLLPAVNQKGNRERRVDVQVEDFCQQAINEVFMTLKRGTYQETLDRAIVLIDEENRRRPAEFRLSLPTKTYIRNLALRIPEYDRYAARYGKQAAEHRFRTSVGHAACDFPLERVEVDHTRLDVILVDEETGLPIGRPWLTMIIDKKTKCILGIQLTFAPPSHASVAKCLRHAIMPKNSLKAEYPEIRGEWVMHGLMVEVVADNGLEFHCESLEAACYALGIRLSFAPRKTPWWKGTIERALGTLNRGVTGGMPGKTFSGISEKGDYDPVKKACISMRAAKACLFKWIVDVYHETHHRSLGMSPRQMWEKHMPQESIRLPDNPASLDAVTGQVDRRKVWHYGIEINSLNYNSLELGEFRSSLGNKLEVHIRWSSDDLGYIYVLLPEGGLLKVPAIPSQQEYATGLTLYQHKLYMRYVHSMNGDTKNIVALAQAKQEIRDMIKADEARHKKTTRIRKHRAKNDVGSGSTAGKTEAASPQVKTTPTPRPASPEVKASTTAKPKFKAMHTRRINAA